MVVVVCVWNEVAVMVAVYNLSCTATRSMGFSESIFTPDQKYNAGNPNPFYCCLTDYGNNTSHSKKKDNRERNSPKQTLTRYSDHPDRANHYIWLVSNSTNFLSTCPSTTTILTDYTSTLTPSIFVIVLIYILACNLFKLEKWPIREFSESIYTPDSTKVTAWSRKPEPIVWHDDGNDNNASHS